ncbi:MAG: hypothetical protein ACOYLB_08880 [Phototrophicaceae bacterium]
MTDLLTTDYYLTHVWNALPLEARAQFYDQYPTLHWEATANTQPLSELSGLMLVAFTGTGKTTTLTTLAQQARTPYSDALPTRREMADWVIIPTAQVLLGEPIRPIQDRLERFRYTHAFAQHFIGGSVQAYALLHVSGATLPFISDGIRGGDELAYALENCPRWHIVELVVSLHERLRRLSGRNEAFDQVRPSVDLSFIPLDQRERVWDSYQAGIITQEALTIIQGEAHNYGLDPFLNPSANPRYHQLMIETLPPSAVAHELERILEGLEHA